MNDKSIRKILIEYLRARKTEIRIYQEKSIGSSICDVMTVTDKLTGYEIKSDLDNYARLDSQIRAYNGFFDENYLVVSERHSRSAAKKIPEFWGIICIHENDVMIMRTAKSNKTVSRRRQLSILWKLELKNLLIKNNMPMYAQKEKGYIAGKIAKHVPDKMLGSQIANELMKRDYSIYDAEDYTIYSENTTEFPAEEVVDMLSEMNLSDFTLDKWIALYKQAKSVSDIKEVVYKREDVRRIPHEIPYTDIEVMPGVPWISADIINDFILHLLNCPDYDQTYKVGYEEITGSWFIPHKNYANGNINAESKYGLKRYNALYILEATLNLREIKLYDNKTQFNEKDTIAALEKQRLIIEEFKNWIWQDEDRRWEVEEAYNRLFGQNEQQSWDGSALTFADMNTEYSLYPYQKDAVQKILHSRNTLLAFDVGAGKTYIMIAAGMKMRKDGISGKNMFVVPNHIVGQWEKIFTELYPRAKVLAIEPKSFKPAMRGKILKQIQQGDYDGIIIAYSCFEMIPLASDTVLNNIGHKLKEIDNAVKNLRWSYECWSRTALNKEKEHILGLTQNFINSIIKPEKGEITFEQLEITTLFLDEAHNYKNLPIRTHLKNLNGINTKGSSKCLDMLHKIRCVQNNGRGAVLATGTPLCNSISDVYTMQMYLQYDEMERTHLDVFDNWVKTFAVAEQLFEIDVNASKFRMIRKFSRFHNLPELSRMFSQTAVFYAADNDDQLPNLNSYTDIVIHKNKPLSDYMKELCERTELIRSGSINPKADNMLKVSTDGRKAALDLKLVGKEQPYDETSKIYKCVNNVIELYDRYPDTTQIIFCDYSTPKGENYSVYKELKEKFAARGIPQKEIAFIHNYNTESRKLELYRKFNAGEVRILIGSTFKLGIGANVQVKLKAIHHLDVPWRPADMVQREGRIIRRGNENRDVMIFRYIAEGSFDSYSWQILETKQRFISQFLSGTSYQRSISDLENNVLSYAEVKAAALAEPLMKQLAEKENELKSLRIIAAKENDSRELMKKEVAEIYVKLLELNTRLTDSRENEAHLKNTDNKTLESEYKKIARLLTDDVINKKADLPEKIRIAEFQIDLPEFQSEKKPYVFLVRKSTPYIVEMGGSPEVNSRRIIKFLKSFHKEVEKIQNNIDVLSKRRDDLNAALKKNDDTYTRRIGQCEAELAEIRSLIQINSENTAVDNKQKMGKIRSIYKK